MSVKVLVKMEVQEEWKCVSLFLFPAKSKKERV